MSQNSTYNTYWKNTKAELDALPAEFQLSETDLKTAINDIFQEMVILWDLQAKGGPKSEKYLKNAIELTLVNTYNDSPKNFETTYKILTDPDVRSLLLALTDDKYISLINFWEIENFEPQMTEFLDNLQPQIHAWFKPLLNN